MFLADYHLHSKFSPDGHDSFEELIKTAIFENFSEIALTDHFELVEHSFFGCPYPKEELYEEFLKMQEKYKDTLPIKLGIELGQSHFSQEKNQEVLSWLPFDFVIGSIHNLSHDRDLYFFDYQQVDHVAIFEEYLKELYDMVCFGDFDVVGHLTYPLRYMWAQAQKTIPLEDYFPQIKEIFSVLIERGKGIEINTSGLRQPIGQTLPPLSLLKLYRQCGGEIVTIGSDAHGARDLGRGILLGQELLKEAGFSHVTTFTKRKPSFQPIEIKTK